LIENNGTMSVGGGSGWAYPPYTIDPLAAINAYVRPDGPDINQHLENWDLDAAALQASRSETALVFINAYAKEGGDRHNLTAYSNGDALVQAVAAVNKNVIVIMHIPGPVLVENWIDHENVSCNFMVCQTLMDGVSRSQQSSLHICLAKKAGTRWFRCFGERGRHQENFLTL
jgi:beta-glucosidase